MINKITSLGLLIGAAATITACTPGKDNYSDAPEVKTLAVETSQMADKMQAFSASYSDYQADEAKGQKHVLFFHAGWCPTCVKWDKTVKENLAHLADDAVIYKTDFDTSEDLIAQYNVNKHSSAVFINADGSVAKTELDPSLDSLNAFFSDTMMKKDAMMDSDKMMEKDAMMEKDKMGMLKEEAAEVSETFSASYTDYDANLGTNGKHVLFFHADWCGTCVKWDGKVKGSLEDLNDNTVIYKVDFDNNQDLAAQYGVTKQSSAVFINADGSVAKTEGDPSLDSINAFFSE